MVPLLNPLLFHSVAQADNLTKPLLTQGADLWSDNTHTHTHTHTPTHTTTPHHTHTAHTTQHRDTHPQSHTHTHNEKPEYGDQQCMSSHSFANTSIIRQAEKKHLSYLSTKPSKAVKKNL